MSGGKIKVAAAVVVFAYFAHGAHPGHGGGGGTPFSLGSVPISGGAYTQSSWARAFLHSGGFPETGCNRGFVMAWERAEGGNWGNTARFNPLDTTQREPGSYSMNSVGVQAYTSWQEGMGATVHTIYNGNYGAVISALRSGGNAQGAADAVAASKWGTGPFAASCA